MRSRWRAYAVPMQNRDRSGSHAESVLYLSRFVPPSSHSVNSDYMPLTNTRSPEAKATNGVKTKHAARVPTYIRAFDF